MSVVVPLIIVLLQTAPTLQLPKDSIFRIVKGTPCNISSYPYLVQVVSKEIVGTTFYFCGGTIISPLWVMTAAHCLTHDLTKVIILAGTSKSYQYVSNGTYIGRKGVESIKHPYYKTTDEDIMKLRYDIAVIRVDREFPNNNVNIEVAKLPPNRAFTAAAGRAEAVGWGNTQPMEIQTGTSWSKGQRAPTTGHVSETLMCIDLPLVGLAKCKTMFSDKYKVNGNTLCAPVEDGKDTCLGDSGGPLIYNDVVIGIVSLGFGCGQEGQAGVYTRVDGYFDFLQQATDLPMPKQEPPEDYNDDASSARSGRGNGYWTVIVVVAIVFRNIL